MMAALATGAARLCAPLVVLACILFGPTRAFASQPSRGSGGAGSGGAGSGGADGGEVDAADVPTTATDASAADGSAVGAADYTNAVGAAGVNGGGTTSTRAWLPPGSGEQDPGPSFAIFPRASIPLQFHHATHVTRLGIGCAACHPGALSRRSAQDRQRIAEVAACDGCHGTDHSDRSTVRGGESTRGGCAHCHAGYRAEDGNRVAPVIVPSPNLRFDHKVHADRNIGCGQCHGSVERYALSTRHQLPRMRGCLKCHHMDGPARGDAKGECTTCHLRLPDGRIRTTFSSGRLIPPPWLRGSGHTPDFVSTHKRAAANDSASCAVCHAERECADCHDGRVRPRQLHPNDWLSMHPSAARRDNPRCSSCHHETFCQQCHARAGLGMSGARAQSSRVHPAGWVSLAGSGLRSNEHAREAQRNLSACVSCHLERDCVVCHASSGRSGLGINPHPPGFSSRCRVSLARNSRPCLVCHEPNSSALSRCN